MLAIVVLCCCVAASLAQATASASYTVDFGAAATPFPHAWEECVGSGHAALSLRADWRAALQQAHADLGFKRVRFHGVFDDDMNVVLSTGTSFFNIDSTYDFLFSIGMAPFVELSFSPVSLSTNNRTIFHYKANISRPQLDKWAALVAEFAAHLIGRYGATVAESLLFEVWNEYNCGFLNATNPRQAYYELYATTAMALKKVSPKLQVGGPATCMSQEVDLFLEYCHKNNLPVDFVSTHIYPTDPSIVNGRIGSTLRATSAQVANSAFPTAPLLYTEFNDGLFGNPAFHDMPFAASWMVKTMASLDGVVPFMSWWTFSDIFEEDGMPSQEFDKPTWTGWGLLSASGIPKPVYRAFQLLHAAGDERVAAKLTNSSLIDNDGDVGVLVLTGKTQGTHIFLFNNHWPDDTSPAAAVTFSLTLDGVSGNVEFNTTRIDNLNANAPQQWRDDGRPPYLSPAQVASYMETSQLRFSPSLCRQVSQSQCVLSVTVPPNGLAILFTE